MDSNTDDLRSMIREEILKQDWSFDSNTLLYMISDITTDSDLIFSVFREMVVEELINYKCFDKRNHLWAWIVDKE